MAFQYLQIQLNYFQLLHPDDPILTQHIKLFLLNNIIYLNITLDFLTYAEMCLKKVLKCMTLKVKVQSKLDRIDKAHRGRYELYLSCFEAIWR